MITPRTVPQPRDDFYAIFGIAAALMLAVVVGLAAPGGQATAAAQADSANAMPPAIGLMVSMLQGRPQVDHILRSETQAYGL